MTKYTVTFEQTDEFGIYPGPGWVIRENGKRLDWPMLPCRCEAEADVREFKKADREMADDEASERRGLRYMGAISPEPPYNAQ